jgi:hypothetical protein
LAVSAWPEIRLAVPRGRVGGVEVNTGVVGVTSRQKEPAMKVENSFKKDHLKIAQNTFRFAKSDQKEEKNQLCAADL